MKRGKKMNNRLLYSLITFGILIAIGVGVYAATYAASGAGHPYTEISTCGANQVLKMNAAGTAWECAEINSVGGGSSVFQTTGKVRFDGINYDNITYLNLNNGLFLINGTSNRARQLSVVGGISVDTLRTNYPESGGSSSLAVIGTGCSGDLDNGIGALVRCKDASASTMTICVCTLTQWGTGNQATWRRIDN